MANQLSEIFSVPPQNNSNLNPYLCKQTNHSQILDKSKAKLTSPKGIYDNDGYDNNFPLKHSKVMLVSQRQAMVTAY